MPQGDDDPPDGLDCEYDAEADKAIAMAISGLRLTSTSGQQSAKTHKRVRLLREDEPQEEHGDHQTDGNQEDMAEQEQEQEGPGYQQEYLGEEQWHEQGWQEGWQQGWQEEYQGEGHGVPGAPDEYWEWDPVANTYQYYEYHNHWWYKATWQWYLWWEPVQA
jgi:hypothetical protein